MMGPDFAEVSAKLARGLTEDRFGILTAAFEAASIDAC
jgi:hypothetical protein